MMKFKIALGLLLAALALPAAVNVPLTVQETIYPGVAGQTRTLDPVTAGVPLPDDAAAGATNVSELSLSGAGAGQFRILGRWPSGRIKWVQVDTLASLGAGQLLNSIALTSGGTGNFGGSNLAADTGSTIVVNTGAAEFTIRKSGFNGIDRAVIGTSVVVVSGSSRGLVLMGPPPGQTTCPPCITEYSSANDVNSTAVIEENGPVKTVIRASGSHVDAAGNSYMRFTVRLYFYKNKTYAKMTSVLRNADYGASNSFAAAYKGHQGYELQITPSLGGNGTYAIANHTATPTAGTVGASDQVYIYQGETRRMKWQDWCGFGCVPYTTDRGYSIVRNGVNVITGSDQQAPEGWADIRGPAGAGIQVGVYQMAAYFPKSLRFNGNNDVRIGIWARENSQPFYQSWPQWSIHDLFLNFHAAPLASPSADFLRFQHYLVARAPRTHYNNAKVFPFPVVDPVAEDAFYRSAQTTASPSIDASKACCLQDLGTSDPGRWPLNIYRFYAWNAGGGGNQSELRWSGLLNFLARGMTGRFVDTSHFYRFQAESFLPHSDGFNWRDKASEINGFGFPLATSLNASKSFRNWRDQEHGHWYGMTDFYFMTGDETIREAMNDQAKDWFLLPKSYQSGAFGGKSGTVTTTGTAVRLVIGGAFIPNMAKASIYINNVVYEVASVADASNLVLTTSAGNQSNVQYYSLGGLYNSRAVGVQLIGAARYSQFLDATGETADAAGVLTQGTNAYAMQVRPDLCVSGYPGGCTAGPLDGGPWNTLGVSRVRGVPWGPAGTSGSWCGVSHAYRVNSSFQPSILIQGMLELRNAAGPGWAEYWNALDLAYGIAQWNLTENYVDSGNGRWDENGFRFGIALDRANSCKLNGETPEPNFSPVATQTTSMTFLAKHLVEGDSASWLGKFKIHVQKLMVALGTSASDFGSFQPAAVIDAINSASGRRLSPVTLSGFTANGGGSYTLSWTVPADTQSYRVKWANKPIVNWIGFDPANQQFLGDPAASVPWFAARNVNPPAPEGAGTTQSLTVNTGVAGLTAAHFSVKAYTSTAAGGGGGGGGGGSSSPSALYAAGGSGQSAAAGTVLPVPLSVRVADASGNGVAGVPVSFAVTAGGGTVTPSSATTDAQGMASTTLRLGATAGANTVVATSGALTPVSFSATGTTATPPTATTLTLLSGSGQSAPVGQALPSPLSVRITDAAAQPVAGVMVVFAVASGGGSLSAAQVATNNLGVASTTLTLGSAAGTNTVTASVAGLVGSPVTFTATGTSGSAGAAVTWTRQTPNTTWPAWIAWHVPLYDPVSRQTLFYVSPRNYTGIYSSRMFAYNSATNQFTDLGGTSSTINACPPSTATVPGDRHPGWQMAIDTKRNRLWMFGGANVNCPDNPRQDMFYMSLNANPADNKWTRVSPTTIPVAATASAMAYDPENDVLFAFGSDLAGQTRSNWVYCPTSATATPGALSARQSAAGCTRPDDWTTLSLSVQPPAVNFPGMVYDPSTRRMLLYGGMSSGLTVSYNQVWSYDVAARVWTRKALASNPPPAYNGSIVGQPAMAYNTATGKLLFHQTHNTGAPADWQYDPVADTWTKLSSSGLGAVSDAFLAYDANANKLISWSRNASTGGPDVWTATLSVQSPGQPNEGTVTKTCDLNSDGTVNVVDVQLAIRQATAQAACGSADLNSDGACTEADVQRIVNASLGGACAAVQ